MNILKLHLTFLQTPHFTPLKNKKINLSQNNPCFFEGTTLRYIVFEKHTPCQLKINIYFWPSSINKIYSTLTKRTQHYEKNYFYFIISK
jgi:hypothetical protein